MSATGKFEATTKKSHFIRTIWSYYMVYYVDLTIWSYDLILKKTCFEPDFRLDFVQHQLTGKFFQNDL